MNRAVLCCAVLIMGLPLVASSLCVAERIQLGLCEEDEPFKLSAEPGAGEGLVNVDAANVTVFGLLSYLAAQQGLVLRWEAPASQQRVTVSAEDVTVARLGGMLVKAAGLNATVTVDGGELVVAPGPPPKAVAPLTKPVAVALLTLDLDSTKVDGLMGTCPPEDHPVLPGGVECFRGPFLAPVLAAAEGQNPAERGSRQQYTVEDGHWVWFGACPEVLVPRWVFGRKAGEYISGSLDALCQIRDDGSVDVSATLSLPGDSPTDFGEQQTPERGTRQAGHPGNFWVRLDVPRANLKPGQQLLIRGWQRLLNGAAAAADGREQVFLLSAVPGTPAQAGNQ
jgi:hypothetical protein